MSAKKPSSPPPNPHQPRKPLAPLKPTAPKSTKPLATHHARFPQASPHVIPNAAQQHDLSPSAVQKIISAVPPSPHVPILEIGAGLGHLTAALLDAGRSVTAIERDMERVAHLKKRFASAISKQQFTLIAGDAQRVLPRFARGYAVVANPPFNLTAALVRHWLLADNPPTSITLVLQKEAAEKLTGTELAHTRSSVLTHLSGVPRLVSSLPRQAVTPPSRVDLAIWQHRAAHDPLPLAHLIAVDALLATAFAGPRTIAEALRPLATSVQIKRQAQEQGWHPADHPRTVAPSAWSAFAQLLVQCGKLPSARSR
jgi:16S rRNA A1518/A1519 N6-dimethyltransferase RsmA/KsgA/DIM1 with predicted DNA glycosylase/AP lyase activity